MEREQAKYQFHTITGGVILLETVGGKTHFIPNKDLKDLSYSLYNLGFHHSESLIIMETWAEMGSHNPLEGLLLHLSSELVMDGASDKTGKEIKKLIQSIQTLEIPSTYNLAVDLHKIYTEYMEDEEYMEG